MKIKVIALNSTLLLIISNLCIAQVGIGTINPEATLHVVSKTDNLLIIDKKDSEGHIEPALTMNNNGHIFTLGTITVAGNYTLPANDGLVDDVLITDGQGNLRWQSITNFIAGKVGLGIKKLVASNTLYTANNAITLKTEDTGISPNILLEELLKLPNVSDGAQGSWYFKRIQGGTHGKRIHLMNDSVKQLRLQCSKKTDLNPNKIIELGRDNSDISLNKGGYVELYYDKSFNAWVVMNYRSN